MEEQQRHQSQEGTVFQQAHNGRWVARLSRSDGTHKQVYCASSEEALQTLRQLLGHAAPNTLSSFYRHPRDIPGGRSWLSPAQARHLLTIAQRTRPDLSLLLIMALVTGMRRSELLAL